MKAARIAIALVILALIMTGCTVANYHRATAGTAIVAIGCDYNQTEWASNGGRWDRESRPGFRYAEMNPMLGQNPSETVMAGAAIGGALATLAVYYAPIPSWLKSIALTAIPSLEITNILRMHGRLCGV